MLVQQPTDIENIKNDPEIQSKFNHGLDTIYEKFSMIKFSLSDLLELISYCKSMYIPSFLSSTGYV